MLGPRQAVLPRSRCLYRRIDLAHLAPQHRRAALDLAVRQGPLPVPGRFACRWQGAVAHVWLPRETTPVGDDERVLAESSLLPPARHDGPRLMALREGVEGQVWADGVLAASRWWAAPPTPAQWAMFLRASGRPVDDGSAVPPLHTVEPQPEPWGEPHERFAWTPAQLESAYWHGVLLLAALLVGWQLAGALSWGIARHLQEGRLERLRSESAPLIAARERAEAAQQRILALDGLVAAPSDYRLLADVRRMLGPEFRLLGWTRDDSRLRIELQGGDDPRPLVQAFAAHPLLAGVVANPVSAGRMQLDVDLDGTTAGEAP